MFELLNTPVAGAIIALVFSAAARALPVPTETSGAFYIWVHNFAGLLLSNYDKINYKK